MLLLTFSYWWGWTFFKYWPFVGFPPSKLSICICGRPQAVWPQTCFFPPLFFPFPWGFHRYGLHFLGPSHTWVLSAVRGTAGNGGQKEGRSWVFPALFFHQGVHPAEAASLPCLQLPPKISAAVPACTRWHWVLDCALYSVLGMVVASCCC